MSTKLPVCIIWCLLCLALLNQRISGDTRPATRTYVSGSWVNISLNGLQSHVQRRRRPGLAFCVSSAFSRGLPCAERCAKAALHGQGQRRHSGFCSSLVRSSFIRRICRTQTKAPRLRTLLFPRKRGMLRTSGASFAWHGSRWLVGSFPDYLPQRARFVAAIFSRQFWKAQTGHTMRCGDYCLHACMNSGVLTCRQHGLQGHGDEGRSRGFVGSNANDSYDP